MKSKKLMAIVMTAAVCVSFLTAKNFYGKSNVVKAESVTTTQTSGVTRLGGADRYETSVKIAEYGWSKADTVFIAGAQTNTEFADALAGTPLAYSDDAPILLTRHDALPSNISAEITKLSPKNIVILGGTGVVSSSIENGLKSKGYNVSRIAGKDRYETAIQIAKQLWAKYPSTSEKVGSDSGVIVTTGKQFQYAMSVASGMARGHGAILFSDGDTLNQKVSNLLSRDNNLQNIQVIGGSKVLGVKGSLYNSNPGLFQIENYNNISELENGESSLNDLTGVAVANDKTFPDSLAGSALAAKMNYGMILSDGNNLPYTVDSKMNSLSGGLIFGGTGVVSSDMESKIASIFNKSIPANPNGLKDTDIISFSDENFKKSVEKALGKTNVTVGDAKQVNDLSVEQVSDLSDLKYFPNLMDLTVSDGSISNNSDISNLYQLLYLHLNNCKYNKSLISSLSKVTIVVNGKAVSNPNQ